MKVICSGMPKTGTKSLAMAMKTLGYNVYDFEEQYFYLGDKLQKVMDEGWTRDEIRSIFDGVDAITDVPGCTLWEELYHAFPEAKVVHTERSSEEEWAKSFQNQMNAISNQMLTRILSILTPSGRRLRRFLMSAFRLQVSGQPQYPFQPFFVNMSVARLRYREHNCNVRAVACKERILYFNLEDGWGPLCKFLEVAEPEQPFPHRNKKGEIAKEIMEKSFMFEPIRREIQIIFTFIALVFAYSIYSFVMQNV